MGINFDNFLSGLAFGMIANSPFFRGYGGFGCCGFGGGYSNNMDIVDFGTFGNGLPYVPYSNYTEQPQLFTTFANPFPSFDMSNICKSIWDNATNPESEQNKRLYDMYRQAEEQQNTPTKDTRTYIPQIQFPFSSFYMPSQVAMNPFITGYYGDYFTPSGMLKDTKSKAADLSPSDTDADSFKNNGKTNKNYMSSESNDRYFSKMLSFVFEHEGGEVNHKHDKGGHTNLGVTQGTYDVYRKKKNLPKHNVKYITKDEATEIYKMNYKDSGADKITNPRLAMCVFDWANHSGPNNERLQKALKECNGDVDKFIELRSKFLNDIIAKDPTQRDFKDGWNNRIRDLSDFVKELPAAYS